MSESSDEDNSESDENSSEDENDSEEESRERDEDRHLSLLGQRKKRLILLSKFFVFYSEYPLSFIFVLKTDFPYKI
jgi:hypothetical protein